MKVLEGILEVEVSGPLEPIFQESTRSAEDESTTGLLFNLEGKQSCAHTGNQTINVQSWYTETGPRRVSAAGKICV